MPTLCKGMIFFSFLYVTFLIMFFRFHYNIRDIEFNAKNCGELLNNCCFRLRGLTK